MTALLSIVLLSPFAHANGDVPPFFEAELRISWFDETRIGAELPDGKRIVLRRGSIRRPVADKKRRKYEVSIHEWAQLTR